MWGQNTLGLYLVVVGLLCFGTPISGKTGFMGRNVARSAPDCLLNTRTPNPSSIQTFFQCTANGPTLMRCPETMVFDVLTSTCVKDDTSPTEPAPTPNIFTPDCSEVEDGSFLPAYCDCNKFWVCDHNNAVLFSCGEGTYWNRVDYACDYTFNTNCVSNQQPECMQGDVKRNLN